MPEDKDAVQQESPKPAATPAATDPVPPRAATASPAPPAVAPKAAVPAAAPKPPAASPPAASPTALEMIGPDLKAFLERMLTTGDQVTVQWKGGSFTGRIFRLMLHEGWIALEHVDGRRRSCWVIQGGKVTDAAGQEHVLPGAASH